MAAARLNADGSIDSSFGNNGIVHVLFDKDYSKATKILLQADDKLILSGSAHDEYSTYVYLALTRLKSDGTTDSTFGENGQIKTTIEGKAINNDALLQKDGKILLGGGTYIGDFTGKSYFVLARYNNDGSKKQIIITKIRRWLQHRNGFTWDNNNNASSYVVQRSYDGVHFNSIEKINAGSQSNFTYADPMPLSGNNYYRLQTTNVSGAVAYSNVIAVKNESVSIYPNPVKNVIHVKGLASEKNYRLIIKNAKGNLVSSAQIKNSATYNLNVESLYKGLYYISILSNQNIIAERKFIKE